MSRLQLIVDGHDLTQQRSTLTWTAEDPGGYVDAAVTLPRGEAAPAGGSVFRLLVGGEHGWFGRVDGPDLARSKGQPSDAISGTGPQARLSDGELSMVWLDRSIDRWQPMTVSRKLILLLTNMALIDPSTGTDTGRPGVAMQFDAPWTTQARCEAWYDAGAQNKVAAVFASVDLSTNLLPADTNWRQDVGIGDSAIGSGMVDLGAGTIGAPILFGTTPGGRYAQLLAYYAATTAAADGTSFIANFTNLVVFGDHGLPLGSGLTLEPADIARDVYRRCGIQPADMTPSGYGLAHLAYYDPVRHQQHLDDLVKLLGWHWGVWAPAGWGTRPLGEFRPPAPSATAWVRASDCDNLNLSTRISSVYRQANVRYDDPAGTQGIVTVSIDVPELKAAECRGLTGVRTLDLDVGTGDAITAAVYGRLMLLAQARQQRAAGSVTLPEMVRLPGGGEKPAALLRPGIDRLRIVGAPGVTAVEADRLQRDTFRIARASGSVNSEGRAIVQVDLDAGADLAEVAQARLEIAAQLAGG